MLKEVAGSERGENGDGHAKSFRDKEKIWNRRQKNLIESDKGKNRIWNMFNSEEGLEIFEIWPKKLMNSHQ